tara:strand:- start:839 stop:1096 length:258 start_codon:yes stop_codon:yes gene_type:complete
MSAYILYISAFLIFIFVILIASKAIKQGVEAKKGNFKKSDNIEKDKTISENTKISDELIKIKTLYETGDLTEEEYKKAKNKILES